MQVVLIIDNSISKVNGLDRVNFYKLREELSYAVDYATARFIPNPANRVKYCIDPKGNFATGLLHRVMDFLIINKISYAKRDIRDQNPPKTRLNFDFKEGSLPTPYPDQENALKEALRTCRGVLSMPTGTGKSLVIALLIQKLGLRTLVVVPTLELKVQLTETFKELFKSTTGITVENIDSPELQLKHNYDLLIIDECHRAAAKTYRDLNRKHWNGIRWRYSFSATPFRNDPEEQLLYESVAGKVIYELTYPEAVEKGYILPVEAYFVDVPGKNTDEVLWPEVYQDLVVNNDTRNLQITKILEHFKDLSTLCLVKEIKHGNTLSELTAIPFSNGADENSRVHIKDFKNGKIKALIGTTGILGEGVDTKPAEVVIIAGLGKAKSAFMQQVGRAVRKYEGKKTAKVVIFRDRSHKWPLTHFREQCKIIKEYYGIEPKLLNLEEKENEENN